MRRLLASALSLCLASPAPAVQFKLPRILTFNVPPLATRAPLQTTALPAHVPAAADAPILAAPQAQAAALAAAMSAASPQAPDNQSAPPGSPASRFSNFFDGSKNFIGDLLRREPRAAAVNASSYLIAARGEYGLPPTSRVLTGAAITALRKFRLDIGHPLSGPGFEARLSADSRSSARKIARLARHVRGIEENHADADSSRIHVLGLLINGKENIAAFLDDRASSADVLTSLLDKEPNRNRMAKRLENSLPGLLVLAAVPVIAIQMLSAPAPLLTELARAYFCAFLTVVWVFTEPYAVLRHRLFRDGFQQRFDERTRRFLAGNNGVEWIYDSKAYALQGGLVDALLRHGKTQEAILPHLWEQDFNSSLGIFGRPLVKMMRSILPGRQAQNDVADRWVAVDRLLRRDQAGEPEMVLVVRGSTSRPRFPKPARESSWAPGMQLAPIPVRDDEFR